LIHDKYARYAEFHKKVPFIWIIVDCDSKSKENIEIDFYWFRQLLQYFIELTISLEIKEEWEIEHFVFRIFRSSSWSNSITVHSYIAYSIGIVLDFEHSGVEQPFFRNQPSTSVRSDVAHGTEHYDGGNCNDIGHQQ